MAVPDRLRESLLNPYPQDVEFAAGPLWPDRDETYPYRLMLGGTAFYFLKQTEHIRQLFSVSYRDFGVASMAVAYDTKSGRMGYFYGVNVKLQEGSDINEHAEDITIGKVQRKGYDLISFMAVIGPPQVDQTSGRHSSTLHPCDRCRQKLSNSSLISPYTTIASATPDLHNIEVYSRQSLIDFHTFGIKQGIKSFVLSQEAENWDETVEIALRQKVIEAKEAFDNSKTLGLSK